MRLLSGLPSAGVLCATACLALSLAGPAAAQVALTKPKPAFADAADIAALLAPTLPPPAPDLFGFSSLPLGQTIYDDIWSEAAARPWPAQDAELAAFVERIREVTLRERVQEANAWVNARVRYGPDPALIDPHWASLAQALARGGGEREDIAIAKMQLLAAAGVPGEDLYLVLASDIQRLKPDALLVVRDGPRVYVLSSRQDALVDDRQAGLFLPIIALGYHGKWIFGRRAGPAALDVGQAAYQSLLPRAP